MDQMELLLNSIAVILTIPFDELFVGLFVSGRRHWNVREYLG